MTDAARKLFEQALALPESERAELMDVLADSLRDTEELGPDWKAEIARRIAAVERGEARLIPGDEVEARIRNRLARA